MKAIADISYAFVLFCWFLICLPYTIVKTFVTVNILLENFNDKVWEENDITLK